MASSAIVAEWLATESLGQADVKSVHEWQPQAEFSTPYMSELLSRWEWRTLGWLEFCDVISLANFRASSPNFRANAQAQLVTVLTQAALQFPSHEQVTSGDANPNRQKDKKKRLQHRDSQRQRCAAMRALGKVARPSDASAITKCVAAPDPAVRTVAVAVIRDVGRDSPVVIDELAELLCSNSSAVCASAVLALGQVAAKKNSRVMELLPDCLSHKSMEVRMAAVDVLERIGGRGDVVASQEAIDKLQHSDGAVRQAALIAVDRVVTKSSSSSVAAVLAPLRTERGNDPGVRRAVAEAVEKVAAIGDTVAIAALSGLVDDDDEDVRISTMNAMGTVAAQTGDTAVVSTMEAQLKKDRSSEVRLAALESLKKVVRFSWHSTAFPPCACTSRKRVLDILVGCRLDEDPRIRSAACLAVAPLARELDTEVTVALCLGLSDVDFQVRMAAAQSLGRMQACSRGRRIEPKILTRYIRHSRQEVREAALAALEQIAREGCSQCTRMAMSALNDKCTNVRLFSLHILGRIAVNDKLTLASILSSVHVSDGSEDVIMRAAAQEARRRIAPRTPDVEVVTRTFCVRRLPDRTSLFDEVVARPASAPKLVVHKRIFRSRSIEDQKDFIPQAEVDDLQGLSGGSEDLVEGIGRIQSRPSGHRRRRRRADSPARGVLATSSSSRWEGMTDDSSGVAR